MSVVYRAHDEVLGRDVAVKVLAGTDASARDRIRSEARAVARLSHPHITAVHDYGESVSPTGDRLPYVVMELLSGRTLARRLADGPLPPGEGLRICAQVAAALATAHVQHLVHRDVTPSNIMLTPSGAKVLDFGIAALVGASELEPDGLLMGTPAYLAPERIAGGGVVPASDVYALGLLLHKVLTTRLPWRAETKTQMLKAHVYVEPEDLPQIDGVPPIVRDLYRRCLAKDPADRPSAAEVERTLASAARLVTDRSTLPETAGADATTTVVAGGPTRLTRLSQSVAVTVLVAAVLFTSAMVAGLGRTGGDRGGSRGSSISGVGPAASTRPEGQTDPVGPAGAAGLAGGPAVGPLPTPAGPSPNGPTTPGAPDPTGAFGGRTSTGASPAAVPTGSPSDSDDGTVRVTSLGGTVTLRCRRAGVKVLRVAPKRGYQAETYDPGPARQVRVVLVSATDRSEITATCVNGRPMPVVRESVRQQGPDPDPSAAGRAAGGSVERVTPAPPTPA
jgi:serine/threonine-protein kinase